MKIYSPKISPCHRTIYFSRLLELIFSETAGLESKISEKKELFWKCLFQGTTSRLAVSHLRSSSSQGLTYLFEVLS